MQPCESSVSTTQEDLLMHKGSPTRFPQHPFTNCRTPFSQSPVSCHTLKVKSPPATLLSKQSFLHSKHFASTQLPTKTWLPGHFQSEVSFCTNI